MIPNELKTKYQFSKLDTQSWSKFSREYEMGETLRVNCDNCGLYVVSDSPLCVCQDVKCYIDYDKDYDFFTCETV